MQGLNRLILKAPCSLSCIMSGNKSLRGRGCRRGQSDGKGDEIEGWMGMLLRKLQGLGFTLVGWDILRDVLC